jgi:hypothetical protein
MTSKPQCRQLVTMYDNKKHAQARNTQQQQASNTIFHLKSSHNNKNSAVDIGRIDS